MASTPTLDSFRSPSVTVPHFPKAYDDAPTGFYDGLYSDCDRLVEIIVDHFPGAQSSARYTIQFGKATQANFVDAIAAAPEIVLQALVPACHLTERLVREHVNIDNLYRFADANASIRDEAAITAFIENACQVYLPDEMAIETFVFLYYRSKERNGLQHARGPFYSDVHTELKANGFAVTSDQSLPGQPNLVINKETPVELTDNAVVGKALRAKPNDVSKRARQAATCCGDLKEAMPNAERVVVFNVTGEPFPNERVREKIRGKITEQNPDAISRVFFSDELDELVAFCEDNISYLSSGTSNPHDRDETHESLDEW